MNLLAARVPLRVRGVPEILDLAFVFWAGNGRILFRLAVWVLVPLLGTSLALRYLLHWDWLYVWMFAVVAGGIAQGVFTAAAGELLFAEKVTARSVLSSFSRRLAPYLGALTLSRAVAGLVAGLPFLARLLGHAAFVREAVLLERASAGQALSRSQSLVRRQEGACLGAFLSLLAAQAGFVAVAELLGQAVVDFALQLGRPFGSLLDGGSPYAVAGFFASVPYVAGVRFLKYIDVRTRKEGWDIQIKFTALVAEAQPVPADPAVA
jgi:hypothetical protein